MLPLQEKAAQFVVTAFRELGRRYGIPPTFRTTDAEIVDIYGRIITVFRDAAASRGDRLSAGICNRIAFKFLILREELGTAAFEDHLAYELEKYLQDGLRPEYTSELNLAEAIFASSPGQAQGGFHTVHQTTTQNSDYLSTTSPPQSDRSSGLVFPVPRETSKTTRSSVSAPPRALWAAIILLFATLIVLAVHFNSWQQTAFNPSKRTIELPTHQAESPPPAPTIKRTRPPEKLYEEGLRLYTGTADTLNLEAASALFEAAAEEGHVASKERLAWMYANGLGVSKDWEKALDYFMGATDGASETEKEEILDRFLDGYRERETTDGNSLVLAWLERLAATGDEYFVGLLARSEEESQSNLFESAINAYNSGDFTTAFKMFKNLAAQGDSVSQFNLGLMFEKGEGVKKSAMDAINWYQRAAHQGDIAAQIKMGLLYRDGKVVSTDNSTAAAWFRKAAEQGDADAQFLLAGMYDPLLGVGRNAAEAVKWYRSAAEQGHHVSQYMLSSCYELGVGVPVNYTMSYKWQALAMASEADPSKEIKRLASLRAKMTVQQVAEAQRLAAAFVPIGVDPAVEGSKRQQSILELELMPNTPPQEPKGESTISSGTGFFIDTEGHLITAHHVVKGASKIRVRMGGDFITAHLVTSDAKNDIALLKAAKPPLQWLQCVPHSNLNLGQPVFTIGFPNTDIQGLEPKFIDGKIGALSGLGDDPRHLQTSLPATNGNSGGPLLDSRGRVVGLIVHKLDDMAMLKRSGSTGQGISFALKASCFGPVLPMCTLSRVSVYDNPSGQPDPGVIEMARKAVALVVAE